MSIITIFWWKFASLAHKTSLYFYRVCPGCRLNKARWLSFESFLTTFEASSIFEAVGAQAKIGLTLKPNHLNQIKLVQIPDTHSRICNSLEWLSKIRFKGNKNPPQGWWQWWTNRFRVARVWLWRCSRCRRRESSWCRWPATSTGQPCLATARARPSPGTPVKSSRKL